MVLTLKDFLESQLGEIKMIGVLKE